MLPPRRDEPDSDEEEEQRYASDQEEDVGDNDADDEEDEDDDEEPRLKYTRLTKSLGGVYRNGDAVSTTLVFGERMVLGTHNGNIHILSLPSLTPLRTYHAHSASVTCVSISPPPPPPVAIHSRGHRDVYLDRHVSIASSSIDGLVCAVPLLPSTAPQPGQSLSTVPYVKTEITLKNFKRPVLAVALSPNFKADRTLLSGGLAGNLILSVVPAGAGHSAGSWMTLGLGGAKDTILHSGEGVISAIAWSRESPRYVAWTNEQGIKIMRSHIVPPALPKPNAHEEASVNPGVAGWIPGLGSGEKSASEVAWKRISSIERPENMSEELASLHKPRLEWIDRRTLLTGDPGDAAMGATLNVRDVDWGDKEKLLVGWGGTVWVIDVFPGSEKPGEEHNIGWAEITHILQTDCIISGIHMYTPSLLLILAYLTSNDELPPPPPSPPPISPGSSKSPVAPIRFRRGRTNALTPELRFVDLTSSEEVSADELMMSRFEGLAVGDYHLCVLPATPTSVKQPPGADSNVGGLGAGLWAAAVAPTYLFSSGGSVRSGGTGHSRHNSIGGVSGAVRAIGGGKASDTGWGEDEKGTKIYITSPYDVVFATERSQADHLQWMMERESYAEAWHLIDRYPEVIDIDTVASLSLYDEEERKVVTHDEEYESDSTASASTAANAGKQQKPAARRYSAAEKEKRRIGELWLRQLINSGDWKKAGEVCGKVLGTSTRWEYWVWVFEAAGKIKEITAYIPTTQLSPPLPSVIYEIVLAYYLNHDRPRFRQLLLETWKPEGTRTLYDARTIVDTILRKIDNREDEIRPGDADWKILQECLAKLYMVLNDPRNALKRYIALKDADSTFSLLQEYRLVDTIRADIPSLLLLRVSPAQLRSAPISELESATSEAISLCITEATNGLLPPSEVVKQLSNPKIPPGNLLCFFYLRRLFLASSPPLPELNEFGDLMLSLFAEYDRGLLMTFLRDSHTYTLSVASEICESRGYIPELVHLLSKTGQTKRALFLIIDRLSDVGQAIAFAKEQDDEDLWDDLINYGMDKPVFIRGLLENVGTAINPIALIRRIPEGLEIPGLKESVGRIVEDYAVQWSIATGVAGVMGAECARGMERLRVGQRRGLKVSPRVARMPGGFEVEADGGGEEDGGVCGGCGDAFGDMDVGRKLLVFACGHVFHVKCLSGESEGSNEEEEVVEMVESSRSVGAKVARAALVRGIVGKGCGVCRRKRKEEETVV